MTVSVIEPALIQPGFDHQSLLGSHLTSNSRFLFVSSNGHNIYNGMVLVYYANMSTPVLHSILQTPETLNVNFGLTTSASERHLAVSGISFNVYEGAVYIYQFGHDVWLYLQKLTPIHTQDLPCFGIHLLFSREKEDTPLSLLVADRHHAFYTYTWEEGHGAFYLTHVLTNDALQGDLFMALDKNNQLWATNVGNGALFVYTNQSLTTVFDSGVASDACFYGSHVWVQEEALFVSCSLYYPFEALPERSIEAKVYVYQMGRTEGDDVPELALRQVLDAPNGDPFFGTAVNGVSGHLAVSGFGALYYYIDANGLWSHTHTFVMPDTYLGFDYKAQFSSDDALVIGHYGHEEHRGGVFLARLPIAHNVPEVVNTLPTKTASASSLLSKTSNVALLVLGGVLATLAVPLLCYYLVLCLAPREEGKKKKKEDEEFSPYKVHSYVGYVETDEPVPVPMPYPFLVPFVVPHPTYIAPPQPWSPLEKGMWNNGKYLNVDKDKKGAEHISASKATIVSYKGYTNEMPFHDMSSDNNQSKVDYLKHHYETHIKPRVDAIKKTRKNNEKEKEH